MLEYVFSEWSAPKIMLLVAIIGGLMWGMKNGKGGGGNSSSGSSSSHNSSSNSSSGSSGYDQK